MLAGGYSLHLYCDEAGCAGKAEFYAETGQTCRREARDDGWIITRTKQTCPECSGKKRKPRRFTKDSDPIAKRIAEEIEKGHTKLVSIFDIQKTKR